MISEAQQETAALYALGLLGGEEAAGLERALEAESELRELVRELRDAAASVALEAPPAIPPAGLRARILDRAAAERKVVRPSWGWIPWVAAAGLAICCGILGMREGDLRRELAALRAASPPPAGGVEQISFCELEPVPQTKPIPRAAVAWDAGRRKGLLRLSHLDPAGSGKDYQLWVVEDGVKDPVSAGVVRVDEDGRGQTLFTPEDPVSRRAVAFAVSLERAGGVPKSEGPILLLGKL